MLRGFPVMWDKDYRALVCFLCGQLAVNLLAEFLALSDKCSEMG